MHKFKNSMMRCGEENLERDWKKRLAIAMASLWKCTMARY
jgi:hypothetical protein